MILAWIIAVLMLGDCCPGRSPAGPLFARWISLAALAIDLVLVGSIFVRNAGEMKLSGPRPGWSN